MELAVEAQVEISDATVLVVEDEQLMRRYAQAPGVQRIIEAVDGSDGLRKMAHDPHVVLTDIHMKPMGGIEFVRVLREHPNYARTHVIVMSGDSRRFSARRGWRPLPCNSGYILIGSCRKGCVF